MSAISNPLHDAVVALQAAANAALALGNAVNMLIVVLEKVTDLETRVNMLERMAMPLGNVEILSNRQRMDSQSSAIAQMPSHVDTKTAAVLLGRAPQTLRKWACYDDGPLRPVRVRGRLAWAVAEIHLLLGVGH